MKGSLGRVFVLVIAIAVIACSPLSKKTISRLVEREEKNLQNQIGLQIYDPEKQDTVFSYRADRYFTPASNTKILTLFTALTVLGDSLPSIRYIQSGDSVIVWGLGDPCFLNPECFNNFKIYNFLNNVGGTLYFSPSNFSTEHFGRGWAWDDYNDYYSVERSSFSIYGNVFSFYPFPDKILVTPAYFKKFYRRGSAEDEPKIVRAIESNEFTYHPGVKRKFKSFTTPFHTDAQLVAKLLKDTLHRPVKLVSKFPVRDSRVLYSIPVDSLYKIMMKESDNHLAEQLLLNCAAVLSDTLKPEIAIRYMEKNYLSTYGDSVVWVDGSGLSRYNLFTPRFVVRLWSEIYRKVPRERLFPLLATGGQPGTLKNWYKSDKPYLFGKTGTVSNNHSISGYLITKSGKTLIFAFMNANYVRPINDVRNNMQRILNLYYENY
jgi:serine-type D-Ala-D-Ala carboxypeptidase/endopeptidase (penicillin-binding protein 4)